MYIQKTKLFFIEDQYTATSSPVAIETASRRDINISMSGSSSSENMIAPEERRARAKRH